MRKTGRVKRSATGATTSANRPAHARAAKTGTRRARNRSTTASLPAACARWLRFAVINPGIRSGSTGETELERTPVGVSRQTSDQAAARGPEGPGGPITAVVFNDPGCPFGYSASPALRTLEWRYRDQIVWHLVTIGLSDHANPSPYGPVEQAAGWVDFREKWGMPFSIEPKARPVTTARACQAITAARLLYPGSEWRVLRILQLLYFNTPLLLDDDDHLEAALEVVGGIDSRTVRSALDSPEAQDAYISDWTRSRQAEGGAAVLQAKTADSPEGPRYTAPSVIFSHQGRAVEIGGFQPVEAYDVAVANLDPRLNRIDPANDPLEALRLYPAGLTTQEIAAIRSPNLAVPDRDATERDLITLLGEGRLRRVPLGNDALWLST